MSVKAVVFDLDDTLYPEYDYVLSGFEAVSAVLKNEYGLDNAAEEFKTLFDMSREKVFDRFAQAHGLTVAAIAEMVDVYRRHEPKISLSAEVKNTLVELRKNGYKLGIITDGRPDGQHAKITALGLDALVDKVIITDELGGVEYRKPNPIAFEMLCENFGISPQEMLYVGDNPQKDFIIGKYGVKTVRLINNGIYVDCAYAENVEPDYDVHNICEIKVYLR